MRILKHLIVLTLVMAGVLSAGAVTDREMEQARAIAAKAYLRFVNNGSGYLDEVSASSISDLRKSLKPKEQENLKAFMSVKAPGNYASWDKKKLVEYWVSVLDSPSLKSEGKAAKGRIRKQINAMQVSAPSANDAEAEASAAPAPAEAALPADSSDLASGVPEGATPADADTMSDILADQNAVADAATPSLEKEQNNTWIYVVVLCLLIGVVIWLVTFAARLMKKQEDGAGHDGIAEEAREGARKAIAVAQESFDRELAEAQRKNADLSREVERLRLDNQRLADQVERLRSARQSAPAAPAPAPAAPASRTIAEMPKVIYLGRANSRGIFVRADRRLSRGNTVYRLDTEDGMVGTFHVVDDPETIENSLRRPVEILSGGCTATDIEDTAGATSIVTENSGTAIFEDGYWKVLRKSRIRYE